MESFMAAQKYCALGTCRRNFLLEYFGEKSASSCGTFILFFSFVFFSILFSEHFYGLLVLLNYYLMHKVASSCLSFRLSVYFPAFVGTGHLLTVLLAIGYRKL